MSKNKSNKKISLFGSQFSTIISVALVLLIIGFIIIATTITHGADNSLRQRVAMVVRMTPDASGDDISRVSSILQSSPFVSSFTFSSAQDVYDEEMKYNAELLQALDSNPYSAEYDVILNHAYVNSDSINAIISRLSAVECIDSAYSSTEVVDSLNYIIRKATLYLAILGIVMMVISIVLIFNTVNLVVYSRRFLIHTMKLVGAKPSFIRRPFLIAGMRIGVVSGVVASALICAIHFYATSATVEFIFLPTWTQTGVLCAVLVVLGALFCSFAAYLAAARFIRYSHERLYKK